ncbi:hypothetical protein QDA04_gp81 [Microbacterium phage Megan]|uniref:Uncharacterized protein n=1 Tax=Microbacterium phage Megan TaxID=2656551 RepID=A0A649VKG1_9CAUD|nr:hypothetical protein QDA04_gp81 [Microbacterium phage Megan]QGJ92751.1 hypothetical protein PBI_MEGAN_81 [Microbacterium phage Megan]
MTMSPRTITVTLSGPQYRELMAALALAQNEWEQDGTGLTSQSAATLERAGDKIVAAWNAPSRQAPGGRRA